MQVNTVKMNESGEIVIFLEQKTNGELIIDGVRQLLPILVALNKSDEAISSNEGQRCNNRLRAVLAVEMIFSAALSEAEGVAEQIGEVATGNISASQLGFPEFNDNADGSIAD